ncbi:class E sortase [Streptomyces sp. WMMC1477]|uniref:class E sortase n=1 Tax=Streptomyces sp. WMMC1477 TaxID=3015155 RepID=UPI0022B60CCB|nr:class E sortase [Streptomyces sp. WMMC1477]MCZ7432490.1 class E sortase [Streptomyces sp. WMMC1477]
MTTPEDPYADPQDLMAAVGRLDDPLNDPLPGRDAPAGPGQRQPRAYHGASGPQSPQGAQAPQGAPGSHGSPWFRPHAAPTAGPTAPYGPQGQEPPGAAGRHRRRTRPAPAPGAGHESAPGAGPTGEPVPGPRAEAEPAPGTAVAPGERPPAPSAAGPEAARPDPETVALRRARPRARAASGTAAEGRVARRRAAAEAARARREQTAVVVSRGVGEVFITCGMLLLLFVVYQLWWTNIQAGFQTERAANRLEEKWRSEDEARRPDAFEPGEGFAIMYIPKLDVAVPVAEGIDKDSVLDKGLVGHYDAKSGLKTAMPWDEQGNFAVAGHRNTHGEPFRYINRLEPGDAIIVETADTYYVYEMTSRLPSTPPANVDVVSPVPVQSGFTEPGRYVTLTTCTPEFTSKYRLIVWGNMVEERPRSEGKPDALL